MMPNKETPVSLGHFDSDSGQGDDSLDSIVQLVQRNRTGLSTTDLIGCCCGEKDCHYLTTTNSLISDLEENVQTAAKLGSALLARHEACMVDAQKEREKFTMQIADLEKRNRELDRENSATIENNRNLLNTLEQLNRQVSCGDAKIRELTTDLDETRNELDRVTARAARMEILEAQLALFEAEQDDLRRSLTTSREEELHALARWQKAEKVANDIAEECNRIERELADEKLKNKRLVENVEKLEKNQPVHGGSVMSSARAAEQISVSNFMKEILSDNAQLQAGTSELRRLLIVAQDEIGALREQVLLHQRIDPKELAASPLSREFDLFSPSVPHELHVHHHHQVHHVGKERATSRKPKKSGRSTPSSSRLGSASKRPKVLGDGVVPSSPSLKRWSLQSAAESAPSTFRESSIFDSKMRTTDDSRPTSAGSMNDTDTMPSPQLPWGGVKRGIDPRKASLTSPPFSILNAEDRPSLVAVTEDPHVDVNRTTSAPEVPTSTSERDEARDIPDDSQEIDTFEDSLPSFDSAAAAATATPYLATTIPGRKLVRSTSHESLLEPETMPIASLALGSGSSSRIPFALNSTSGSSQPILTTATARNTPARYSSHTYNRILLQQAVSTSKAAPSKRSGNSVAGWFWTKFAPGGSSTPKPPANATSSLAKHIAPDTKNTGSSPDIGSPRSSTAASVRSNDSSSRVVASPIDEDSLRDSLAATAAAAM